jgi:hypothetical protein
MYVADVDGGRAAMPAAPETGDNDLAILPVVVMMRAFPARPSSVPDVRDFVRRQLTHIPLSADAVRTVGQRVAEMLLDTAGSGGMIQVLLRTFPDSVEVDVLRTNPSEATGSTTALALSTSPGGGPRQSPPPPAGRPLADTPAPGPRRPDEVTFAQWLATALRREGMTMEAAARRLKVSVKTVSRWVGGTTEPRLRDLSHIREIFGDLPFP